MATDVHAEMEKMRRAIRTVAIEATNIFRKETGLNVTSIKVEILDNGTMDDPRRTMVGEVKISVGDLA